MKIKKLRQKKNTHLLNYTDFIKSKMNQKDMNSNLSIKNSLQKIKKIKLNYLSNIKPKESLSKSIDELIDTKRAKLKYKLNSFQKTFYDFNKKIKRTNDKININHYNNNFSKEYNIIKNNNNFFSRQEMLEEIKELYNKKNISLPLLQNKNDTKNLFKKNLLLSTENEAKNSIEYNLYDNRSNDKSIIYFKKIEDIIHKDPFEKMNPEMKKINEELEQIMKDKSEEIKVDIKNRQSILNDEYISKYNNEINKLNDLTNNIEDIDFFFESNTPDYIKYLKGDTSKTISKYSTKDKTGFSLYKNNNMKKINKSDVNNTNSISKYFYKDEEKNENASLNNDININKKNITNKTRLSCFNIDYKSFKTIFQNKNVTRNKSVFIPKINLYKESVENLYNKIKDSEDYKNNNKLIKSYLPEKKYKEGIKIFPINLYKSYKITRNCFLKNNFCKKNYKLKFKTGVEIKDNENIEMKEKENELKLKSIDEKMEELLSKLK